MFLRMPRLRKMTKPKPRRPVHFLVGDPPTDVELAQPFTRVTACGSWAEHVHAWTLDYMSVTCVNCLRSKEWYCARVNAALETQSD